ncbi:MAG: stress response translation initiation inhibitor YciH [Candidatus Omnitrophica bacterium]|jgi:translation initiation factor 1|nr:stress response translation initiation inhibitor YciH [Candidatus Omnitrophota bacterium]
MSDSKLIYSTSLGSVCPGCAQAVDRCVCADVKKTAVPDTDGIVRLSYEKGRKGKGMTVICGLALSESGLLDLARRLKQRFGTGGSVKDYAIELQGDFRKPAEVELRKLGFIK